MSEKVYVLDTNVLIHDPESIYKFEENTVVIPFKVIEELDHLKGGTGEIAYSARQVLREIDRLRETGDISQGVKDILQIDNPFDAEWAFAEGT